MTIQQHTTFTTLQQRWSDHHDLRQAGASLAELVASRAALDEARLEASIAARRAA